ncbi:MAG: type II secretion system protein M [Gammaproteobacteria bacterium]|nr:type II secretion system protein M [Gammaproteobacteria bacterium]
MKRLLTWFPTLAVLQRRIEASSRREQILLMSAAYLIAGLFLYFIVLAPALEYRTEKVRTQAAEANGLTWMLANKDLASMRMNGQSSSRGANELATLASSAKLQDLAIKRMQPDDNQISIEMENQNYSHLIKWLVALETEHGFSLLDVRIDKVSAGLVDTRILVR